MVVLISADRIGWFVSIDESNILKQPTRDNPINLGYLFYS